LIHPTWFFFRILGENVEEIIDSEKRLFYVALTRAKNDLFIITEKERETGFLIPLLEGDDVVEIDWDEFPTDLRDDSLLIEIRNQQSEGIQPTLLIKDLLKENGFSWDGRVKAWRKYVSRDRYSFDKLINENWYKKAHGIEITVSDDQRLVIEQHMCD